MNSLISPLSVPWETSGNSVSAGAINSSQADPAVLPGIGELTLRNSDHVTPSDPVNVPKKGPPPGLAGVIRRPPGFPGGETRKLPGNFQEPNQSNDDNNNANNSSSASIYVIPAFRKTGSKS